MMEKEEWKKQITIPAKTCIRIKCWNTTGLYLCNVSSFPQRNRNETVTDKQQNRPDDTTSRCTQSGT